jgi:hypothetical protein
VAAEESGSRREWQLKRVAAEEWQLKRVAAEERVSLSQT